VPACPPESALHIVCQSGVDLPYDVAGRLSRRLERFLLLARLLTAGTVQSVYEVSGSPTLVARMNPHLSRFHSGWFGGMVRRTIRLSDEHGEAFAALGGLLDAADVKREGMIATSFDVALTKFNQSHAENGHYEDLVDLATALEAALIGTVKDTERLTLRLPACLAPDNVYGG
jgi:hypothetical protein